LRAPQAEAFDKEHTPAAIPDRDGGPGRPPLQVRRIAVLESASMHEALSTRDRLTFDEYLYLTDKLRRAERLLPHELRALERHEAVERTGRPGDVPPDSYGPLTESS
jgi:hypothetical protein